MSRTRRIRAVTLVTSLAAVGLVGAAPVHAAAVCGELFDDFHYSSHNDSSFASAGWNARGEQGGPGVPGATWSPDNITFPTVDGDQVAQLTASTDGTSGGTSQAELLQNQLRFRDGTYASRIRFTDKPTEGQGGDHVNETYFVISPLRYDYDPLYSELDFSEYLPNGGWGETQPANFQTSYYTFRADPWDAKEAHDVQRRSFDGWHDLVTQVADGHVKYYIDGELTADHTTDSEGNPVYPRQAMTLSYNLWFIDTDGHTGGRSTYVEQVDWTYYAKNQVLTPSEAVNQAAAYRSAGTAHTDTIRTTC